MSNSPFTSFELVGGYAGQTINLSGHQFIEGVFEYGMQADNVIPSDQEVQLKADFLAKNFQAYPVGSAALEEAQARLSKGEPIAPGELDVSKAEAEAEHQTPPEKPAPEAETLTPPTDRQAKGALRTALLQLDPTNDTHWTAAGLPSVEVVRGITKTDVSRADINEVAPNLTREEAAKVSGGDPLDT